MGRPTKSELEETVRELQLEINQSRIEKSELKSALDQALSNIPDMERHLGYAKRRIEGFEQRIQKALEAIMQQLKVKHGVGLEPETSWGNDGKITVIEQETEEARFLRYLHRLLMK